MTVLDNVKNLLAETLSLGHRKASLTEATVLLGNMPELDSMAVVTVITAIEDRFGLTIEDDEISADTFATVGSLANFVERKLGQ